MRKRRQQAARGGASRSAKSRKARMRRTYEVNTVGLVSLPVDELLALRSVVLDALGDLLDELAPLVRREEII